MEIISNVANGVIDSRKRSINDHTKHVECRLSKDESKHLDGKVVIRDFLQTLKVCVKNTSELHDVSNHEVSTSSWEKVKLKMVTIVRRHRHVIQSNAMEMLKLKVTKS